MKQIVKLICVLLILIGLPKGLNASNNFESDSIKITQIVNEFYDWYLASIKEKKYSEFKPTFIESENGMTTLDYPVYFDNLRKYRFSETLIIVEKQSYYKCIENLVTVKFSDFQNTIYTDLDDFASSGCDFGNYYRWTGGQEPIDGIRINNLNFISSELVIVSINYFENEIVKNIKHHWGENNLNLIKIDNEWFINKIDSRKND